MKVTNVSYSSEFHVTVTDRTFKKIQEQKTPARNQATSY